MVAVLTCTLDYRRTLLDSKHKVMLSQLYNVYNFLLFVSVCLCLALMCYRLLQTQLQSEYLRNVLCAWLKITWDRVTLIDTVVVEISKKKQTFSVHKTENLSQCQNVFLSLQMRLIHTCESYIPCASYKAIISLKMSCFKII